MAYITINGSSYYSPCENCKDKYCYSCILVKYQKDFEEERDKRLAANFRIENELEPRIKAEKQSYDSYISTDRSAEWSYCLDFRINELIEMFDEDFDFSTFNFDDDDITSKIAKVIYENIKNT